MSIRNKIGAALIFTIGTVCAAQTAVSDHHAKSGSYDYVLSAVTDFTTLEQLDHVVRAGPIGGTITIIGSSGGPYEVGASSTILGIGYIKKSDSGIELESPAAITDSSGDKWYNVARRNVGDQSVGGGGKGRSEITGGTGKYEGMTGTCEYTADYLAESKIVVWGSCHWQRD